MKKELVLFFSIFLCCFLCGCGESVSNPPQEDIVNEENVSDLATESEKTSEEFLYDGLNQDETEEKSSYEKGKELSEDLTEKLENIDWEEAQGKARDAGRKLAGLLNGEN